VVKKISHEQSRRNAARRRRRVAGRHAQAGHWDAQPSPMFREGPVAYEVGGNVDATCFGGIAAVHRLVSKLGLPDEINELVPLLKVHLPYHESDHVLNLAYNVMCGGTRLEDIERLRQDTAYMNALGADLIPDPTTAGDFCRRFTEQGVAALLEAINAVRPKLWAGRGRDLLGPVAYLDADGTIAPTTGRRKAGMDMSYKGIWGYAPLIVSLANTREVLYLVNRPGNAPSHQDAAGWIDKAIDLVAPHAPRVCLRGDTDFSLTANFDRWARRGVDFVFGMDASPTLRQRAEALDEQRWRRLHRPASYQTAPARPAPGDPTTRSASCASAATSTWNSTSKTSRSSSTSPASAPAPTGSSRYARTSAKPAASKPCSTRCGTSSTSPPTWTCPWSRSSGWPTSGATRKTSSNNSRTASTRYGYPSTTCCPTGRTWSAPPGLEHQIVVRDDDAPQGRPA
jgi:hypothetical protein